MKKQLVFSLPSEKIPVINLFYGDFSDDGFKPVTDLNDLSDIYKGLFGFLFDDIHFDKYFNNTPFIEAEKFDVFFSAILAKVEKFSFYPNLFVCTFKSEDHGTEEENPQA